VLECDAVIETVGWLSNLGSVTLKDPVQVLPITGQHEQRRTITVLKPASPVAAASTGGSIKPTAIALLFGVPLGLALLVGGWYVSSSWRRP
jgi:hypothetical protein